jgi:hypothetical protein
MARIYCLISDGERHITCILLRSKGLVDNPRDSLLSANTMTETFTINGKYFRHSGSLVKAARGLTTAIQVV